MAPVVLALTDVGLVEQLLRRAVMTKIAAHPNPVRRPRPSFMLRAALDDVGGEENYEQLWTKRLDDDRFEVCCIPFFAYDLALGDVVRADAGTGYVIQSVTQRSGHGVIRVAVKQPGDVDALHLQLHDLLGRLEYLHEWFAPGYVAIDVEPARSNDELYAGLAALGEAVEIERILI
jgi:hypothetical protein